MNENRINLFCIDDDPNSLSSLSRMVNNIAFRRKIQLNSVRYHFTDQNTKRVLGELSRFKPDLLVTDYRLTNDENNDFGFEIAQNVRRNFPDSEIICVSAKIRGMGIEYEKFRRFNIRILNKGEGFPTVFSSALAQSIEAIIEKKSK